jgi:2OG-Fe(II) oxygenase superfamily
MATEMDTTREASATPERVCDLSLLDVRAEPFPHVVSESFIEPEHYRQLCRTFPVCPPSTGPTGFSLYWGDEEYRRLLEEQPAWRSLFETFHSQAFVEWGMKQFAEIWQRDGCKINPAEARYVPYREDRVDKERATLRKVEHEPHQLWVRVDIHQGRVGYFRPVHLDHARRLVSMLIYFCDHAENRMDGGELFLHGQHTRDRVPTRIAPRHNLMVAFPCTNGSQHSVSKITSAAAPRNYVQVHISSSVAVWPREAAPPLWRRALSSFKRRLGGVSGR